MRIRYLVQGEGDPVVLIHGLHSHAAANWRRPGLIDLLARDHRVIALDLPGHGGSDKPEEEAVYGLQMVEDVVLLLDHLNVPKAQVVGYSLGGMVALKLIAEHPDRVRSGVLGAMGWLREGGRLQAQWERMPARDGARTPAACVNRIGDLALTEAALMAIRTPVAILIGDRDPVQKLYVAPLLSVRKDWPVTEIRRAGHMNAFLRQEFADGLVQWLNRHRMALSEVGFATEQTGSR